MNFSLIRSSSPDSSLSIRSASLIDKFSTSQNLIIDVSFILTHHNIKDKIYIIYEADKYDIFYSWWTQSLAAKKCWSQNSDVHNPSWNNCHWSSKYWNSFLQAAEKKEETSVLICKNCSDVIQHGTYEGNRTGGMKSHVGSKGCTLQTAAENTSSENIAVLMVSLSNLLVTLHDNNPTAELFTKMFLNSNPRCSYLDWGKFS